MARSMRAILENFKRNENKELINEYQTILSRYGRQKDYKTSKQNFETWKKITQKNGVTPSQHSENEEERKIASRMADALINFKKNKKIELINEYQEILLQYGRKKYNKTPEKNLEEWKNWTLEHKITPSQYSKDSIEKSIATRMSNVLSYLKKTPEKNKEIIEEYNKIYAQYGRQKIKKLQKEKQELLNDVSKLKEQAIKAENMEKETKEIVDKHINDKSKDRGE